MGRQKRWAHCKELSGHCPSGIAQLLSEKFVWGKRPDRIFTPTSTCECWVHKQTFTEEWPSYTWQHHDMVGMHMHMGDMYIVVVDMLFCVSDYAKIIIPSLISTLMSLCGVLSSICCCTLTPRVCLSVHPPPTVCILDLPISSSISINLN